MTKHTAKNQGNGQYTYRGWLIEKRTVHSWNGEPTSDVQWWVGSNAEFGDVHQQWFCDEWSDATHSLKSAKELVDGAKLWD